MARPSASSGASTTDHDGDSSSLNANPHARLLERVDRLNAALASTTFSVTQLIALNRSLDVAESIVDGAEAAPLREAAATPEAKSAARSAKSESFFGLEAGAGNGRNVGAGEDVMARVARLVAELQRRHDESRVGNAVPHVTDVAQLSTPVDSTSRTSQFKRPQPRRRRPRHWRPRSSACTCSSTFARCVHS